MATQRPRKPYPRRSEPEPVAGDGAAAVEDAAIGADAKAGLDATLPDPWQTALPPGTPHALPPGPAGRRLPTMPPLRETRVGKTLRPGQGGTVKLGRRFGDALLQVRYRYDWTGLFRYTTVELLVDISPVHRAASLDTLFSVRLSPAEATLMEKARRHGAEWHEDLLCWTLTGRAVQALDLAHRAETATSRHRLRAKRRTARR